jgi:spore coat protein U-like protein
MNLTPPRLLVLSGLLLVTIAAAAQEVPLATAQLQVNATVVPNCRLEALPLDFGAYDPLGAHSSVALQAYTELILLCTRNTSATISLDGGVHGTSIETRALAQGLERLEYQLFHDSARSTIWGSGASAASIGQTLGTREPAVFPIFGSIPPAQEVTAGSYSDVITARVDF